MVTKITESKSDYREPIKCLHNSRGDCINVYKDKETGRVRAEGDIIGASFNGPWDDEKEKYYKSKGFKEVVDESSASRYIKHYKDGKGHYISVYRGKDGELYAEGDVPARGYTVKWDNEMAEYCEIDLGFEEIKDLNPAKINLDEYEYCSHADGRDAHWHLYRKIVDGKGKWVAQHQNTGEIREITYDQARGFEPIDDSAISRLSRNLGSMLLPRRESTAALDLKKESVEYKSLQTSPDIAATIARLARNSLGLSSYETETLEHDINNLRANEWVDSFLQLGDKSNAKKLFFTHAVCSANEGNIIEEDDSDLDFSIESKVTSSHLPIKMESSAVTEGLYGYFNYTATGPRNKPIYSLVYGNHLIAKYDKNDWSFVLGAHWEGHIDKLIEWLSEYYPGFFLKKDSDDSVDYRRFIPTPDEAIQYIEDKKITILPE